MCYRVSEEVSGRVTTGDKGAVQDSGLHLLDFVSWRGGKVGG